MAYIQEALGGRSRGINVFHAETHLWVYGGLGMDTLIDWLGKAEDLSIQYDADILKTQMLAGDIALIYYDSRMPMGAVKVRSRYSAPFYML